MNSATPPNIRIGQSVRRKEDQRLLTGKGCFSDDVNLPGQACAVFVRSPHAHARIRAIDTKRALAQPGVIAVLTGRDMLADGLKPLPHQPQVLPSSDPQFENSDGTPVFSAPQYALATAKVRHVGDALAIVVADTLAAARDGAENVEVDYEVLPSVTVTRAAADPNAPRVFDEARSNVCLDGEIGNAEQTAAAFAKAAHVVRLETWVQRVTGVTMEPRAAVAVYDAATGRFTLHAGSGGAVKLKQDVATALNVPAKSVRVLMQDVGGNFGTRGAIYPEFVAVAWAARRCGRPVKWVNERHEAFVSDYQGRDLDVTVEIALDEQGTFLGLRGSHIGNAGGHTTSFAPVKRGIAIMCNIYRMPAVYFRARAVVSNTLPTRAYRSSGRPEAMFAIERLIDVAASKCGFDRVEIRRRNLLTQAELPHTNPFGLTYDSGAYHAVFDEALALGDWPGFAARREEARQRGKRRGIGVANYVDTSSGVPRERAEVTVHADGRVDVVLGVPSQGQGHETTFGQMVCEWLGVPFESVRLITGDTDVVAVGGGAHGGRGTRMGSVVIWKSAQQIIARGARIAARLLESDPSVVQFADGAYRAEGLDEKVTLFEVAAAAQRLSDLPEDLRGPLTASSEELQEVPSFPYGTHVCEVEVDPELGTVEIVRYAAVDDVGRAVNPLIIHGQVHGGIAQGAGQALLEHCYYHPESGQVLSGTLMDYAMPRADHFPMFKTSISEVPATTHPLGIRPAGESGITPAPGAVINAVVDALAEYGVTHIDMPATPEKVWRAIHEIIPSPHRLNPTHTTGASNP